jgi:prepilin-type N-terminal cleavage/methylation domain-containing protein
VLWQHRFANFSRRAGFTLAEIMITVSVIGLICAVAIPSLVKSRANAQKRTCIANLREIDAAVQQWALENKVNSKMTYKLTTAKLLAYLKGSKLPICPAGGTYKPGTTIADVPDCSRSAQGHSL